ncbi:MAG: hypothetical protein HY646_05905 [Acidobacteria bacterium]|nr:hypothetical protein [Acidobacteriota bacterium]
MSRGKSQTSLKERALHKQLRKYHDSLSVPVEHEEDIRAAVDSGLYFGRPELAEGAIRWLLRTNAQLRKEIRRLETAATEWSLKGL